MYRELVLQPRAAEVAALHVRDHEHAEPLLGCRLVHDGHVADHVLAGRVAGLRAVEHVGEAAVGFAVHLPDAVPLADVELVRFFLFHLQSFISSCLLRRDFSIPTARFAAMPYCSSGAVWSLSGSNGISRSLLIRNASGKALSCFV